MQVRPTGPSKLHQRAPGLHCLLLLFGVSPSVGGVSQGCRGGSPGLAPPCSEGEVVGGLDDGAVGGVDDCPHASEVVGDVDGKVVTHYRTVGIPAIRSHACKF